MPKTKPKKKAVRSAPAIEAQAGEISAQAGPLYAPPAVHQYIHVHVGGQMHVLDRREAIALYDQLEEVLWPCDIDLCEACAQDASAEPEWPDLIGAFHSQPQNEKAPWERDIPQYIKDMIAKGKLIN